MSSFICHFHTFLIASGLGNGWWMCASSLSSGIFKGSVVYAKLVPPFTPKIYSLMIKQTRLVTVRSLDHRFYVSVLLLTSDSKTFLVNTGQLPRLGRTFYTWDLFSYDQANWDSVNEVIRSYISVLLASDSKAILADIWPSLRLGRGCWMQQDVSMDPGS